MVGRAQAWAGGTFLHHLLPKPSRTGPALPACPLTQSSRSQASLAPSPTPSPPQSASPPLRLWYLLTLFGARGDDEPWQKDHEET